MAETPSTKVSWVNRVTGGEKGMFGRLHQDGLTDTLKTNFKWEAGNKSVVFGRVAGAGIGLAIAGDALFRGKTEDGEDRSSLARVGQFVLGTGVAAGAALAGKGR